MNALSETADSGFEALLAHIRDTRGFDFTGYKRASLVRRIRTRMQAVGMDSFEEYLALLEAQPEEFAPLFDTVLINVTAFRRDPEAWDYLAESVLPRIVEGKDGEAIRMWSAGCASGEEPYTLAVLLCDLLGEDRFKQQVKIYGTDADDDALTVARHARYRAKDVVGAFSGQQVERYFEAVDDDHLAFRTDLRRAIIFGRHDLVRDAPISRVDLVTCRNTLMYLTTDVQRRVLSSFHFALNPSGYLMLGKAEALAGRTTLFTIEELKQHIFVKRDGVRERPPPPPLPFAPVERPSLDTVLLESAVETSPLAQLVVDREGRLVVANRHARTMFGIGRTQLGRPLSDLEVSYRPVELRSRIDQVFNEHRPLSVSDVDVELPGIGSETLDVHLIPLGSDTTVDGVSIVFEPIGRFKALRLELERSQRELEAAYEELQSTVEELETTNEELQSTNEELETTNEELHSTNEELETMNEELQSTNEELETINNELRERSSDLDELNSFLAAILSSLGSGVVVLNSQLGIRVWNRQAEELWGLRSDEVQGSHFLNLDIGLPVGELRSAIRACVLGESLGDVLTLDAVDRRGRPIRCSVAVSPLRDGEVKQGVILVMDRVDAG